MRKLLITITLLIFSKGVYTQSASNSIFKQGDEIRIQLTENATYFYLHEIKKGHSLYTLSKIFNVSLATLYSFNQIKEATTIQLGQKIKIPLKDDYLFKGVNLSGLKYGHFIPVYYKTKPKDNLFRISRIYFNQPTDDLVKRNNLTSNDLALGQDILIGWLPIDSADPIEFEEEFEEDFEFLENDESSDINTDSDLIESNEILGELVNDLSEEIIIEQPAGFNTTLLGDLGFTPSMKEIKKSQVAHWDNTMPDNGTVYVLHKNAIIDSYVEMYNPNMKRSVRAKVIGRIPYGAYTNDVCLVLSPRTAVQLGGLDNRFKVEIKALVYESKAE